MIPIDLRVAERRKINKDPATCKGIMREETVRLWQQWWDNLEGKAAWTKRLIPDLAPSLGRKHGEVHYHLSQFLTGHGSFGSYLKQFRLIMDDKCPYCEEIDTPYHTIYKCIRWSKERIELEVAMEMEINPENTVTEMVGSRNGWR